jgi:hypothetical protein
MPGRPPARLRRLLLAAGLLAAAGLPGCRRDNMDTASRDGEVWVERVQASAGEARRRFDKRAGDVRDDLEAARVAAEAVVRGPVARGAAVAEETRRRAAEARRRADAALGRGARLLEDAAHDGGQAAESWARLIQDRMMRLEATVQALSGAEEHAGS